jgi:Leucine-rich repeat (LRR) protein
MSNKIETTLPLAELTKITRLYLSYNKINDISGLSQMAQLYWLKSYNNNIHDISPLAGLINLTEIDLVHNQITDLLPLLSNGGLGGGDGLGVFDNPLDEEALTVEIPALQARGVYVWY